MQNSFFTPQEIKSRKRQPYKLSLIQSYDFTLLKQDLFQIVSPHVESISDQKRKIISWLKKSSLLEKTDILTYTNKQFVCLIRSMYEKKQSSYYDESSTTFTISYIQQSDQFDLLTMVNNKKLSKQYLLAQDDLLGNIRIMSRYTQFDSITFSEEYLRNVDLIFNLFEVLGDGIAHQLTTKDFERLSKLPNSTMFYDPSEEHCYKKASIGTWITEVFMKHISMRYFEHQLYAKINASNELKQKIRQFEKYWKIITPERKNEIIRKVLQMKPIDLYQEHRLMIKVTRNGFPPIEKSDKIPQLIKSILTSTQKEIFDVLFYSNLNQTLESHSILKYYITLQLEDEIRKFCSLQANNAASKESKMKKKKKKNDKDIRHAENLQMQKIQPQKDTHIHNSIQNKHVDIPKQKVEKEAFQKCDSNTTTDEKAKQKDSLKTIGNVLFYKKLEVSETQQIISFQSTYKEPQLSKIQSKQKKKRKNKKKNASYHQSQQTLNNQQNVEQKENIPHSDSLKQTMHENNQQLLVDKNCHIDKHSQKSSQTTNDHMQQSKLESLNDQIELKEKKVPNILADFMNQMEKKLAFYNKQRKIVLNRISYVFAQHQLPFKLYGSSSYNLALPSSDIDIVVDPSIVNYFYFTYSNYRKKIVNSLEYLQKVFEKYEWASDFVILPGANIPLLTFTVDPGKEFEIQHGGLYNNKKQLKEEIRISVDVTVEPYVNMTDEIPLHLGVESSQLVKQWINTFPFYSQILTLVKIFTRNHNLHKMYHGGISSFMHAVLLAGFYKRFFLNLNAESNEFQSRIEKFIEILPSGFNLTQMFVQYCTFITSFNEQREIIDINSHQSYSLKSSNIPSQQLVIINPLTGTVMSERCTTFSVYKKLIQQVLDVIRTKKQSEIKNYIQIVFQS